MSTEIEKSINSLIDDLKQLDLSDQVKCRIGLDKVRNKLGTVIQNSSYTTLYTVQQIDKDDKLFGPVHGSTEGKTTVCGNCLDDNWFITSNAFDGIITCESCLKLLEDSKGNTALL